MPTVLVTGANRGLGLEFARQYAAAGWTVHACAREPNSASELRALPKALVRVHGLDVADFAQIDALARELSGEPIDLLLNNAGLFGPKRGAEGDLRQSFGHIDYEIWEELLRVNALAPVRMAEAFVGHVEASEARRIVALSSAIGSIADTDTGLYAYRTSKAALNMAYATLARELAPRGIRVRLLCPGWVRTRMGGPQATVTPEESVRGMRARIEELEERNSGSFVRYNGDVLRW